MIGNNRPRPIATLTRTIVIPSAVFLSAILAALVFGRWATTQVAKHSERQRAQQVARQLTVECRILQAAAEILASRTRDSISKYGRDSEELQEHIKESTKTIVSAMTTINIPYYGSTVALKPGATGLGEFAPYYYNNSGNIGFADLARKTYDYQNKQWYRLSMSRSLPCWSEPYTDSEGGEIYMMTYSTLIRLKDSSTPGIATADMSIPALTSWYRSIMAEGALSIRNHAAAIIYGQSKSGICLVGSSHDTNRLTQWLDGQTSPLPSGHLQEIFGGKITTAVAVEPLDGWIVSETAIDSNIVLQEIAHRQLLAMSGAMALCLGTCCIIFLIQRARNKRVE